MWPFRNNQGDGSKSLPDEVREYYRSQRSEGRGIALLIGLSSLVVTVLIAAGLFYGGRWAYRTIRKPDNKPAPAVTETSDTANGSTEINTGSDQQPSDSPDGASTPAASSQPGTGNGTDQLPRTGPDSDL